MTSVLKKSKGTKGKSESMHDDLPDRWGITSRGSKDEVDSIIKFIDDNIIGKDNSFCGPFGRRKVVYCDYSGSGRAQKWIEEFLETDILPIHATRCSALSYTSGQSEVYKAETKAIIRNAVCASKDDIVVIGATLSKFLRAFKPKNVAVFVSSRETERQLTPWREFDSEIIKVNESKEGFIDLNHLETKLQEFSQRGKTLIGFFPAASKLTGVLADDVATTLLLHQYGALSFWDYTLVAPSAAVNMNPTFPGVEEEMVKKDVVFFNCEKFVGGVQGPNVTVFKKHVFRYGQCYSDDNEVLTEKVEEWKCIDGVRASLAMQLRDSVGLHNIAERQDEITRQVLSHIKNIPELILLGSESATVRRLPIFSIMVKHPRGTFLHHNFICAVLNDIFGIQARGGLDNNLNYGHDVLGIDEQLLKQYEKLLDVKLQKEMSRVRKMSDVNAPEIPIYNEHLRPGFCRVSLPFFMSDNELAFVLEALKMVATEGWKIMPQYVVVPETGQWRHHSCSILRDRKTLYSLRFQDGKIKTNDRRISGPGIFPQTYTECLQTARNLFNKARKLAIKCSTAEPVVSFNPRIDYLRWFMLPKEAHDLLLGKSGNVKHIVPFDPSGFTGARKSVQYTRSSTTPNSVLGSSRHYSLTALDDCHIYRFKQKQKLFRDTSLTESHKEEEVSSNPVKFAIGESVSPVHLTPPPSFKQPLLIRSRCYSLGSETKILNDDKSRRSLLVKESSPISISETAGGFCHCGSQTDLQSLDDPMISPGKSFPYRAQSSNSISDCSQTGRSSPTTSVTSQTSEDIQTYLKEMTKEIATEIKSEIREVISKVDDILENSDAIDHSNLSINSSHSDRNSVSVTDVAEYLMGMSREMASEVKHEIREMVNQVDVLISPDILGYGSRKNSPPNTRQRIGSGPELGLDTHPTQCLKKCSTSPVLTTEYLDDELMSIFCKTTPSSSPLKTQRTPSLDNSQNFNSSETSTPDTIIQVVSVNSNLQKSSSSNKLSDEDICNDASCRSYCTKRNWSQNPSISSQDSGINLSFGDADSYIDFVKWRTSSDPTTNKARRLQGRLRMCNKYEKSEVPDIIEGVPVCSGEQSGYNRCHADSRVNFKIPDEIDGVHRVADCDHLKSSCCCKDDNSSVCSDSSLIDFTFDDEGKWHCPPKPIWKNTVEAIHEYNMIRPGDKVLVCLSGSTYSVSLLHTIHQYQFYARSKGIHFSVGALFVHESHSSVDPLHLMAYCRTLGVKFIYQDKMNDDKERRNSDRSSSLHRWSSHAVRRRSYNACVANGYTVAAIAQHLDHAARSFVASTFHGGVLATTKAHYCIREHNLRIIRPFIYVREQDLDAFAVARMLPDFRSDSNNSQDIDDPQLSPTEEQASGNDDECVFKETKICSVRSRSASCSIDDARSYECARAVLTEQERMHPSLFTSLKNALHPLIKARNIERDLKESRHRKKSVIQMKNGAPVYDSEEGTEEEPVS